MLGLSLRLRAVKARALCRRVTGGGGAAASQTFDVRQGGLVSVDLSAGSQSAPAELEIVSAWQDFCLLECNDATRSALEVRTDVEAQTLSINARPGSAGPLRARVTVPQSIDLSITGRDLRLSVKNKVEGDVSIECAAGTVELDKVRGMNLSLQLGAASLTVRKLLEGNLALTAGSVVAKMLNGDNVAIAASHDVSVEAMYAQQAQITAGGSVTVGGLHGSAVLHAKRGALAVSGVDGSVDLLADEGNVSLQINRLSPAAPSVVRAPRGGVQVRVDPEVEAWVRCESQGIAGRARVTVVSDSFEKAALPGASPLFAGLVTGRLTGRAPEDPSAGSGSGSGRASRSGKIDLAQAAKRPGPLTNHAAAPSSAPSSASAAASTADPVGAGSGSGSGAGTGARVGPGSFDLSVTAHGHIRLETLSWFEAIRRKYGFTEEGQGSRPGAPGRSASAGARARSLAAEHKAVGDARD